MLETPQERVKLLKAGITGKTIERLYLVENNFKLVRSPVFFEMVEIREENKIILSMESDLSRKIRVGLSPPAPASVCQ